MRPAHLATVRRQAALTLALAAAVVPCPVLEAQSARVPLAGAPADLDQWVTRAMRELQVPGLALVIVKDGKVLALKGYGTRTAGRQEPVNEHTIFQIASNTKAFTSAALAMLVDEGKLRWDDRVQKFLPWFELYDPWVTREFTVRDLLTHRSGLGLGAGDLTWWHSDYGRDEIVRRLRVVPPVTSFRTAYAYDNVLYIAAGLVVEAASGRKWDDFIRERIFTPLGMTDANTTVTTFRPGANVATPHGLVNGKMVIVPRDTVDNVGGAGTINASVADLSHWLITQLDSGRAPDGKRLWSARRAREMWSGVTVQGVGIPSPALASLRANFAEYALGWGLRDYRGRKLALHTGGLAGMVSRTVLVPEERLGIVVLTNAESPAIDAVAFHLLDQYLGGPTPDLIAGFKENSARGDARADSVVRAAAAARDRNSRPSLPLERYAGRYTDALYGDASITQEGDHLVLRFAHSPAFVGDLEHWQYDTFVARWRVPNLADAYVSFALKPDGSIDTFRMAAVSPAADFSFDYQDLTFRPAH